MNFISSDMRRPSTCLYIVVRVGDQWWVDREGKSYGPCDTRNEAESAAFQLIELFGDPARPVEVWSPNDDAKIRLVWKGYVQT